MKTIKIKKFCIGKNQPLTIICGPCVIESEDHALFCAEYLMNIFKGFPELNFIFKSSYDKANRSAHSSFRGPGIQKGLEILAKIQQTFDLPVLTDIHSSEEAVEAAKVVEIIQIPAFLCRQTDLIVAAAQTGAILNIKKGQFMSPWDMQNVINKILISGNDQIILTDRGTSFGYNNLVSDMRAIPIMQEMGYPACYDASHSVQLPGGLGNASGGQRQFIPPLAQAAIAAGANCLFIEAHPNPIEAKSDKESVLAFDMLPKLLATVSQIYQIVQKCEPC
ncbi:2-dehydro-3-deoxyphosphooctonate aldolase [Candidatus Rhabdochlamydia oedothoracis]|uniref:2-dehydro-3-deoxyphosphooctonate aldolase n=1 Tax=Candidatus Rhabdochlamydia oedothoracis TaxID=2720720 RepID=A0ABX8V783_9BACT|nr:MULTISPECIES: 3-deoxy-8-phosphooctulonate synthase [Rhabdochlamydia]KAG6559671.1 2-dehydro-3-deoxyphosphooctonate aldolase [Candidatus Rhabdochlamydia sp. W815]MCL6755826.1 3-deoxy-8-phosphooctulonate synthase [Candidatus Rhabdochlamydia oedothoracis]QYF49310.1 2-dehydro-3-deoxyphosphooctonate aldolase [Candidatus Rhabdochlamydia oedothoracis]